MRWLLGAVAIALGCSAPDEGGMCALPELSNKEHETAIFAICGKEGLNCQWGATDNLSPAAYYPGTFNVVINLEICSQDWWVCRFAVWHEAAHAHGAESEEQADCVAARTADPRSVDATLCWLDRVMFFGETNTTHGTAEERLERIARCR